MANDRARRRARNLQIFRAEISPLESRVLLTVGRAAFASLDGMLSEGAARGASQVRIAPGDFTMPRDRVLLSLTAPAESAGFDPGAIRVVAQGRSPARTLASRAGAAGDPSSTALVSLGRGAYAMRVGAQGGGAGSYRINVSLAGDMDGDHRVNAQDLRAIRSLRGVQAGESGYMVEADVDRDGEIDGRDLALARRNRGVSTAIRPMTTTMALAPDTPRDARGRVTAASVMLVGQSSPGASIALDLDADSLVDLTTTADDRGTFRFALAPRPGLRTQVVTATDAFGQRSTARLTYTRVVSPNDPDTPDTPDDPDTPDNPDVPGADRTAPSVTIAVPGPGLILNANPTIAGRVTDDRQGTITLVARVDGGADVAVPVDASGSFGFTTSLATDGTAEGPHSVRFRATDAAGNASPGADFTFSLDTVAPSVVVGPAGVLSIAPATLQVSFSEPVFATDPAAYSLTVGSTVIPISSATTADGTTFTLNLAAPLADGIYRLSIGSGVIDRAGNALAGTTSFAFTVAQPVAIASLSPADGEELVSLTRETVVRFDDAVDPATITPESLYLIAKGARIPGTIRVSPTERFALFFPDEPLPESTEVRVVVDGDKILGRDGLAIDGDGDGLPGGLATADFSTLPLTFIPGTRVFGYIYDSYNTNPDGSNIPVVGATISLDAKPGVFAVTDANGFFELGLQDLDGDGQADGLPAPELFVHIDGTTATNAPAGMMYARLGKPFHTVPGQRVQLEMDGSTFNIFLPPMAESDVVALNPDADTVVGFGPAGKAQLQALFPNLDPAVFDRLRVDYPAGSAQSPTGSVATRATVIPVNPNRLPAPLPPTVSPQLVISVQAGDANGFNIAGGPSNFLTPAPISFPNLDNLAPGEKSLIWSFDHDAGKWVIIGTGTVTADGLSITSDPGTGILAPGWHFTEPGSEGDGDGDNNPDDFDPKLSPTYRRLLQQSDKNRLSEAVRNGLANADAELQDIKDGRGDYVFDDYNVTIDEMPPGVTPEQFLGEMLNDLNSTVQDSIFDAINQFNRRNTGPPIVGEIIDIDILGPDNGSVVLSEAAPDHFDFSTVETGFFETGSHPEHGSREFGFSRNQDGSTTFYTRGASRPRDLGVDLFGDLPQTTGWARLMRGISDAIDRRGGRSRPNSFRNSRHDVSEEPDPPAPLRFYYRIQYIDTSDPTLATRELAGVTNNEGEFSAILPGNSAYSIRFFNPATGLIGTTGGVASPSGSPTRFGMIHVTTPEYADVDGDGLGSISEFILGTSDTQPDSDGDGISDSAELTQGLNPLDNRGFPTGVIASLTMPGSAEAVEVVGDRVYVATGSHGLAILDGSRFDRPVLLGQIDLAGTATDVGVDPATNLAAIAAGSTLQIVDVSDPMVPVNVGGVGVGATRVEVFGGLAYAVSGTSLRVIDLATRDVVQALTLPGSGSITGLAREGAYLYAFISGSDTLAVVDIATQGQAKVVGQLGVSIASTDVGLFVGNGTAWLSGSGLRTVDVTTPASPKLIHGADNFFTARRVTLNGSGLALVAPDGGNFVQVYDARDPNDTDALLTRFNLSGPARDVAISRGIGYIAAGGRLEVVNFRPFDTQGQAPTVSISTSAADQDGAADGIQVLEGTTIPIRVAALDDVQVRQVELLVNGVVVQTDVSFPFDFAAVAPTLASGAASVQIQVRATDTGGNVGLSNVVTLQVVPDTTAPTVVGITPGDGGRTFVGNRTIRIRFSEPIRAADATAANFQVVGEGPDGAFGTADDLAVDTTVTLGDGDRLVQIAARGLVVGSYRIVVRQDAVADRAGNVLGAGFLNSAFAVEERTSLLTGRDVVFVIDVSGSTGSQFGGTPVGDVNGDGSSNTILDAELAAVIALNQEMINLNLGATGRVSIITFESGAAIRDMDPKVPGVQVSTAPESDVDGNGVRDVEQVIGTIRAGGGTVYDVALQRAIEAFEAMKTVPGEGNLIFLSDGEGSGSFLDEVARLEELGVNRLAYAVGNGASLTQLSQIDRRARRFTSIDELLQAFLGISDD